MMEDMRPNYSKTRNLDLVQTNPEENLFSLYVAGGPLLGTMDLISGMRLQVTPAAHLLFLYHVTPLASSQDLTSTIPNTPQSTRTSTLATQAAQSMISLAPPSHSTSSLSSEVPTTPVSVTFCLSGDFRGGSWIIIMKFTNSRQQRLIGESRSRQISRKNVRESKWTFTFEVEDSAYSQLLLASVCYLTLVGGERS